MKKLLIILAMCLCLAGCTAKTEPQAEYFAKIGDTVITEEEYNVYLNEAAVNFEVIGGSDIWNTDFDGKTAEQTAKETALNSLLTVKISALKFDEYGYSLTEEELKKAEEDTDSYIAEYNADADRELIKTIMTDKAKYTKIRESTYANYVVSEAELEEYIKQYGNTYRDMYTVYSLDTVLVESTEKGNEFIERFNNGESFEDLAAEYETDESITDESRTMNVYKREFENVFGTGIDVGEGQITPVLTNGSEVYVMRLNKRTIPSEEQVRGIITEEYTYYAKQSIFSGEFDRWKNDLEIEVNEEAYADAKLPMSNS